MIYLSGQERLEEAIRRAFKEEAPYIAQKRAAALKYLGEKWVLYNKVTKKVNTK